MILRGDARRMPLAAGIADAVVTDPPYELGFMGKRWDRKGVALDPATWIEALRVAKLGAHLVAFGGARTFHRLTCAIEDAGWDIRDCLCWLYGQGFPKSLNLPGGIGTALKPAWEPIILARKSLVGSVAANVRELGTGGLNIGGCRLDYRSETDKASATPQGRCTSSNPGEPNTEAADRSEFARPAQTGRWPANVCLDEVAAALLDEQTGVLIRGQPGFRRKPHETVAMAGMLGTLGRREVGLGDAGGASRFFYVAKASRSEREEGCESLSPRSGAEAVEREPGTAGLDSPRAGAGRSAGLLDTSILVCYPPASWVVAVLHRRLPADMAQSAERAIVGSTTRCSDGFVWSMCWCGSPSTDPFHPAIRSIIGTESPPTTASATSNSSRRQHTNGCMAAASGVKAAGGNLAAYAEFRSPWMQEIGTSAKRDGPSMDDVGLAMLVESWLKSAPEKGGGHRVGVRNFHPT